MPTYAKNTTVDSGASRSEIERTLVRFGCDHFGYMTGPGEAIVVFSARGRRVQFRLPLPDPTADEFKYTPSRRVPRSPQARQEAYEQAVRQRWRALALAIKAKLESVESGIESLDEAFMAHLVVAGGRTMAETVVPHIEEIIERGEVKLALPGRAPLLLTG